MKKSESESGVLSSACVFLQQRGTHALTPLNKTEKLTSNKNLQDKNDFQILILSRLFFRGLLKIRIHLVFVYCNENHFFLKEF